MQLCIERSFIFYSQCIVRCMGVRIHRDPCILRIRIGRLLCVSGSRSRPSVHVAVHEVLLIPQAAADREIFIEGLHLHTRWFRS